ncbi:hypothetical protein AAOGI_41330 [Agarivorans albus]
MKMVALLVCVFSSFSSLAGYNANFSGRITHVLTYTYTPLILIRLEGQPSSHPVCGSLDYLAIDGNTPDSIRMQVLSRVMTAYTTGEVINIGYDKEGDCVGSRIRVHRVG